MLRQTMYSSLGGPSVSGTGRRRRTGVKPTSAVASRPCRYSWALEVSELRRGSITSVFKDAKVSGLAKTDKCSSEKLWRACARDWHCVRRQGFEALLVEGLTVRG